MILTICHPELGRIKMCDVSSVDEGFYEINRYLDINDIETTTCRVFNKKTATLIEVCMGRLDYADRSFGRNHNLEMNFEVLYDSPEAFLAELKSNRYSCDGISMKNFEDVVDVELPNFISKEYASSKFSYFDDTNIYRQDTLFKKEIQTHDGKWETHAMVWTYPEGYSHIKKYMDDLKTRHKEGVCHY